MQTKTFTRALLAVVLLQAYTVSCSGDFPSFDFDREDRHRMDHDQEVAPMSQYLDARASARPPSAETRMPAHDPQIQELEDTALNANIQLQQNSQLQARLRSVAAGTQRQLEQNPELMARIQDPNTRTEQQQEISMHLQQNPELMGQLENADLHLQGQNPPSAAQIRANLRQNPQLQALLRPQMKQNPGNAPPPPPTNGNSNGPNGPNGPNGSGNGNDPTLSDSHEAEKLIKDTAAVKVEEKHNSWIIWTWVAGVLGFLGFVAIAVGIVYYLKKSKEEKTDL